MSKNVPILDVFSPNLMPKNGEKRLSRFWIFPFSDVHCSTYYISILWEPNRENTLFTARRTSLLVQWVTMTMSNFPSKKSFVASAKLEVSAATSTIGLRRWSRMSEDWARFAPTLSCGARYCEQRSSLVSTSWSMIWNQNNKSRLIFTKLLCTEYSKSLNSERPKTKQRQNANLRAFRFQAEI